MRPPQTIVFWPGVTAWRIEPIFFQALQRLFRRSRRKAAGVPARLRSARSRFFVCGTHLRFPRTFTLRPLTCFCTVSVATPASLDVNVNVVPWPGVSVESPICGEPAVGGVVSGPPGPPGPLGSGCGSIRTTRIELPLRHAANPVPSGPASTCGLRKVSRVARLAAAVKFAPLESECV